MFDSERLNLLEDCCKQCRDRVTVIENSKTSLLGEMQLIRHEIKEHKHIFENHDENEMEKYDNIKNSITKLNDEMHKFNRILWVTVGVVAVLNFLGITDSIKHIIQTGVSQNYKIGNK